MRLAKVSGILTSAAVAGKFMVHAAWAAEIFCNGSDKTDSPRINTALGCIPVKMSDFMVEFLPYLFGIAGGISFLLMAYGFILVATSGGDPKAVQGAKETITSAITGLVVSILSIFILKLVAINILRIPGF